MINIKTKKAQVQFFLENAFRIGFLMVALFVFFLMINFFIVNKIDTNRLQAEVTATRLMYSDTFMLVENARTYVGIVDMKNFNDATIGSKVDYSVKKHAAARLDLINNTEGKTVQTAYLNKAQFDNLYVLSKSGGKGKGGATQYIKTYPVTYVQDSEYRYGTIRMIIIIPNS